MTHLYVELLKDSLNEYSYAAEISGLEYQIESTLYGLQVPYKDTQTVVFYYCWLLDARSWL